MKKPKSQSLDTKNGFNAADQSLDSDDVDVDPSAMIVDDHLKPHNENSRAPITAGVTANLSRKKATPPNPTSKKLVIKLVKG